MSPPASAQRASAVVCLEMAFVDMRMFERTAGAWRGGAGCRRPPGAGRAARQPAKLPLLCPSVWLARVQLATEREALRKRSHAPAAAQRLRGQWVKRALLARRRFLPWAPEGWSPSSASGGRAALTWETRIAGGWQRPPRRAAGPGPAVPLGRADVPFCAQRHAATSTCGGGAGPGPAVPMGRSPASRSALSAPSVCARRLAAGGGSAAIHAGLPARLWEDGVGAESYQEHGRRGSNGAAAEPAWSRGSNGARQRGCQTLLNAATQLNWVQVSSLVAQACPRARAAARGWRVGTCQQRR
jgi:hypothetical protein